MDVYCILSQQKNLLKIKLASSKKKKETKEKLYHENIIKLHVTRGKILNNYLYLLKN